MVIFYQSALVILLGFWMYSLFSCLEDDFKKKNVRSYWLIAHLVFPLTGLFYIFFKKKLLK